MATGGAAFMRSHTTETDVPCYAAVSFTKIAPDMLVKYIIGIHIIHVSNSQLAGTTVSLL